MQSIRVKMTRKLLDQVVASLAESDLPLAEVEISGDAESGETHIRNLTTGDSFAQQLTSTTEEKNGDAPLRGSFRTV